MMRKFVWTRLPLALVTLLAALSAEAGLRGRCRRMCRPEVVRCRAAGYPRASCRRTLIPDCIASGATVCLFVPPTATTTTIPGATTTTTTTTTLPVTCRSLSPGQIQDALGRPYGIVSDDSCGLYGPGSYPSGASFSLGSCSDGSIRGTYDSPFGTVNVTGTFNGSRYTLTSGSVPTGDCTSVMTLDIPTLRDALGYITINGQCGAYSCVTSYRGETTLFCAYTASGC